MRRVRHKTTRRTELFSRDARSFLEASSRIMRNTPRDKGRRIDQMKAAKMRGTRAGISIPGY
jgi:hypothetical protein